MSIRSGATSSGRRRAATVAVGGIGAGWVATAGLLSRSDAVAAAVPIGCPFKSLTGLDCPGCGSTRSLGALTRLDVAAALDHHVLVPFAVVFVVASFAVWTAAVWRRSDATAGDGVPRTFAATDLVRRPSVTVSIAVVVAVFAVLRNLEVGEWLAAGRFGP